MWPNPKESADVVTFTEEILHGKLLFLCSDIFTTIANASQKRLRGLLDRSLSPMSNKWNVSAGWTGKSTGTTYWYINSFSLHLYKIYLPFVFCNASFIIWRKKLNYVHTKWAIIHPYACLSSVYMHKLPQADEHNLINFLRVSQILQFVLTAFKWGK